MVTREDIFELIRKFHAQQESPEAFVPGKTRINYAGRVFDSTEMVKAADALLDFTLTAGRYANGLEKSLAGYFGARRVALVNSGSSANLLAVAAACSQNLDSPLKAGDEVITPAVTFPTTLTPIIQNGLVPVLVDCELGTYNIDPALIENAISPRTRALCIPHTLGNPCRMDVITDICKRHGLLLIEDCCDAIGSEYHGAKVGTFGNLATLSFYPAHHMTMGEGGGVVVNDAAYTKAVVSIRDWGRDCWCEPATNDSCGHRFDGKHGDLPEGYDHKYVYSNYGYNLKLTDIQAAIGTAQWEKFPGFCEKRRENFRYFYDALKPLSEHLVLPRWEEGADPAWFGFPLSVREHVSRHELIRFLEDAGIETRLIFSGNIIRQPGFTGMPHRKGSGLDVSDQVMNRSFFTGVYPGLREEAKAFIVEKFTEYFRTRI